MYASLALTKPNLATVLAVNDGRRTGPFHSDQSCCDKPILCILNKLGSFPTNMLHVCFGSLFWLPMYCISCVLYLCTRCVLEVVLVCNKTVHHPALGKYHTSTLENAINSVNYMHNRSPEQIKFLDNIWLHRRTVRPIGSDSLQFKLSAHSKLTDSIESVTLGKHQSNQSVLWGGPSAK